MADADAAEAALRELADSIEDKDLEAQLDRTMEEVGKKDDSGVLDDLESSTAGLMRQPS